MTRLLCLLTILLAGFSTPGLHAQAGFAGRWEGVTPNRQPVLLVLAVNRQALTGRLTVGDEAADVKDGKASQDACSFVVTIDGRTSTFNGRKVGDDLELTPQGFGSPVLLKRAR